MEVPSPTGLGVGDINFQRTRLLCDGCPPLGVGWVGFNGWTNRMDRICSVLVLPYCNNAVKMD